MACWVVGLVGALVFVPFVAWLLSAWPPLTSADDIWGPGGNDNDNR